MAVLAPSGENCQPWRFEVTGSHVRVFNIPERDQSPYNYKQFGSFVAHGALLENMRIAASQFGIRTDIHLFPVEGNETIVADIELVEDGTIKADLLCASITVRVTNRKPYKKDPLTASAQDELQKIVALSGNARFAYTANRETIESCAEAASTTEKILFSHPLLHSFFFSHINWSYKEELKKRIGFYLKTLEVPPPAALLFRIWKYWPVMNIFNRVLGINTFIAKENAKTYKSSSAIGAVIGKGNMPADFVEAGMITQRVWLTVASLGMYLQPLTGILFFMRSIENGNENVFSVNNQQMIREAYTTLLKNFSVVDGRIVMMFRIGCADVPSAQSVRLPADIKFQ